MRTSTPKYEVSHEEVAYLENELRAILGIGEEEGDAALMFRNPDKTLYADMKIQASLVHKIFRVAGFVSIKRMA